MFHPSSSVSTCQSQSHIRELLKTKKCVTTFFQFYLVVLSLLTHILLNNFSFTFQNINSQSLLERFERRACQGKCEKLKNKKKKKSIFIVWSYQSFIFCFFLFRLFSLDIIDKYDETRNDWLYIYKDMFYTNCIVSVPVTPPNHPCGKKISPISCYRDNNRRDSVVFANLSK